MRRAYARGAADIATRRERKEWERRSREWQELQDSGLWWTGHLDPSLGSEMLEANGNLLTKAQWGNGYLVTLVQHFDRDPRAAEQHARWVNAFRAAGLLKDCERPSFDGGNMLWHRIKTSRPATLPCL